MTAPTFTESVEDFAAASPWLGATHAPALTTLRVLADTLDNGDLTPALVAQFGLTFRSLAKLAPPMAPPKSLLAAALDEARSQS